MRIACFLVVLFMLGSCQQRLVPGWYDVRKDTTPVAEISEDDVTVRLENLEVNSKFMVFDLELVNNSYAPISFDTEKITGFSSLGKFKEVSGSQPWTVDNSMVFSHLALSHKDVNDLYERKIRNKNTLNVLMAVAAVGLIVYDIAADADDYSSSEWTANDARKSATRDAVTAGTLVALDVVGGLNEASTYKTLEDLEYLPDEIFNTNVIPAGESYRGKIYLNNE